MTDIKIKINTSDSCVYLSIAHNNVEAFYEIPFSEWPEVCARFETATDYALPTLAEIAETLRQQALSAINNDGTLLGQNAAIKGDN